jgi:hypothetical protein
MAKAVERSSVTGQHQTRLSTFTIIGVTVHQHLQCLCAALPLAMQAQVLETDIFGA